MVQANAFSVPRYRPEPQVGEDAHSPRMMPASCLVIPWYAWAGTSCIHYELTPAAQKLYLTKARIRAVLQAEERESSLVATCSGRLPTHAVSTCVPWVKLRLYVCSLPGKLKKAAGVVSDQSSLHKGLESIAIGKLSHGLDEITYKECTEKKGASVDSLAISHHRVWANSFDTVP